MKILDSKLSPYEIHKEGNNYIITEKCGTDKNGKQMYKTYAYCSKVENALSRIAKMKVESGNKVYDLSSYISAIKKSNLSIQQAFPNIFSPQ